MIPDLPKGSAPSTLFLQNQPSSLNDIHSPSIVERPTSQPNMMTDGNQPATAKTAHESQASDSAVYAVVNHRQSGIIPVREQHTATEQNKNAEYAAIGVS